MYYNVSEVPGILLLLFQHSAISSSFTTLCTIQAIMSNLCQNLSVSKNYPLTCINQEICRQKLNLYAIFWKNFTFMKFRGDYYDIHEKKIIFISNASWEILNRTFLADFQGIMEVSKLPWLQKKEYQE